MDVGGEAGVAGFCLNTSSFIEFMEGSDRWKLWAHENGLAEENSIFFSAHTYGIVQVRRHLQGTERPGGRAEELFRLLRRSSLGARILPATAEIMDFAADQMDLARTEEGWTGTNATPFIEYATAYSSNLTLVITDHEDDPSQGFDTVLDYPISTLRLPRP